LRFPIALAAALAAFSQAPLAAEEPVLPRSLAPWESPVRLPWTRSKLAPPTGRVRTPAEYEENEGLLIRWGSLNTVLTEIAVALSQRSSGARLWIVVADAAQQSAALSTLTQAGVNPARLDFIQAPSNSVWIRDYGPRFVGVDGRRAIIDHVYNRPRPLDDAIPQAVAGFFGEPRYELPLVHGGGNFHLWATQWARITELILAENPGSSASDIASAFAAYQGLDLALTAAFPASYDSTQHIDMWLLPVSHTRAIVGEYAAGEGGGVPRAVTEGVAAALAAQGIEVLRTPGWRQGGVHYTYTNAVILDDLVLICRFNGFEDRNQQARAVFEQAFPGRQIHAIDCSSLITFAGALHCIVMHVPAEKAVARVFRSEFERDG
jgi:agmatine/peptidylarginine deiminase